MRIAILNLTTPFPELAHVTTAGHLIRDWLQPVMPEADLRVFDIARKKMLPGLDEFDGLVLSGSELGVYDKADWMVPLRRLLLASRDAGKSIVGICFGHQLMADTFGGKAEKTQAGVVVGVREFVERDTKYPAYTWHQDQVVEVPPGARILARANHCPVGALEYDFAAFSVQYHPEYRADFMSREVQLAGQKYLEPSKADMALASIRDISVEPSLAAARSADILRCYRVPV